MERSTAIERGLAEPTLCAAFLRTVEHSGDRVALSDFGSERRLTYGDWYEHSRRVAGGLAALGVSHGDRVALLMGTRLEFHVVDMGALLLGAVPYSLYVSSPVSQLAPSVAHAAPRVLVCDAALADTGRALQQACPCIEHVVVIAGDGGHDLAWLQGLCPADFDAKATAADVGPEDLCSLVFTSGTTAAPKGVPYLHRCLMQTMASLHGHVPYSPEGRVVSYLPMAHIAERMFGHYAGFVFGCHITSLPDATQLGAALREVRPTRFFGVPRIWEKLLAGIDRALAAASPAPEPGAVPALVGLDAAEWLGVAGAPAGADTLQALHSFGLEVNELYGTSETIIVSTSPPHDIRIGTCGLPLPGVGIALAGDGEILVSGVTTMPGYFRATEQTAEALVDGWMHTGDVGTIDADGYLTITDRKKALIISSAGKNMSPSMIEQAIKGGVPLIAQVVAVGDRRPYVIALIVLDRDGLEALRTRTGIAETGFAALTRHPQVRAAVDAAVHAGNAKLSRPEQVKRHAVLDHDWAPASEELTPTAKLKRAPIERRYADTIESLYAKVPA